MVFDPFFKHTTQRLISVVNVKVILTQNHLPILHF
jgi:hypothetical protein